MKLLYFLILVQINIFSFEVFGNFETNTGATLSFYSNEKTPFTVVIENKKKEAITKSTSFLLDIDNKKIQHAFVGIPIHLLGGEYNIVFANDKNIITKTINIKRLKYPEEKIKLNKTMIGISRDDSPEKTAQIQRLWKVLSSYDENARYSQSPLIEPIKDKYRVSSRFGDYRTYIYDDGTSTNNYHFGHDFAAPKGTKIYAPTEGKVVLSEDRITTGKTIIIEHFPSVYSLYYHLETLSVKEGDMVKQSDIIGEVGSTGFSTGPHLHWEFRVNTIQVDPISFLNKTFIDKKEILSKMK